MSTRTLIVIIGILLVGGVIAYFTLNQPTTPAPQQSVARIGVFRNPPALDPAWEGFQARMKVLGYEEGKNVTYKVTEVGKDLAETKQRAEELVNANVDLIFTMGVLATRATKEVTEAKKPSLPVVFGVVSNPVAGKLVGSIKSSGNNLTGVSPANEIIASKRLELTVEMLANTKRMIFAWNDPNTTGVEELRKTAKTLKVTLIDQKVANQQELNDFLDSFSYQGGDVIFRATDSVSAGVLPQMIKLALERKVPLIGTNVSDVERGALMSYGANYSKIGEQAARLVDAILKGAKPTDLPIELPEQFELVLNTKTADTIGVTISPNYLSKANRVINR